MYGKRRQDWHTWLIAGGLLISGCACPTINWGWRPISIPTEGRNMIPDRYPLGSVNRAHYAAMQTNAEATDFTFNLVHFVGETSHLTPDGQDHLLEVAARMRSAPFPVIVERTPNNSNPPLDAERRATVSRLLADLGNPDADQRTFVAVPWSRGLNSYEGMADYSQYFGTRGFNGNNNNGNNGFGGGFGGAGGGGGFF